MLWNCDEVQSFMQRWRIFYTITNYSSNKYVTNYYYIMRSCSNGDNGLNSFNAEKPDPFKPSGGDMHS